MASIPVILQAINNANVNQTGEVQWLGVGGQKEITTQVTETLRDRGVYTIPVNAQNQPDITALQLLGASDTRIVFVQNLGLYVYSPSITTAPYINAAGGGVWALWDASTAQFKSEEGNGSLVYTINHNLATLTPGVRVFDKTSSPSGLPYIANSLGVVRVITANQITITLSVAAPNDLVILVTQ